MTSQKCKPNICTYTALINAFAREGLCEKAEEIFEQLQEAGIEPDVYAYNALMEAYRSFPKSLQKYFCRMLRIITTPTVKIVTSIYLYTETRVHLLECIFDWLIISLL